MKKNTYILFLFGLFHLATSIANAQSEKKINFSGNARSLFYADKLSQDTTSADTVTVPKLNSGHVLVDLGINIKPNSNTEILGMVRIRNDYGGFWGSGVSFDVRQLYVKGVIGGIVRYQLGDINYKMSRYTLRNYNQEIISNSPAVFQQQTDLVNYDHFYSNDHSWRQQGAATEFALVFKKIIQEIQFHAVTTRVKSSDFATINDRLFSGLNTQIIQGKHLEIGVNYVNLYDVPGTSRNNSTFQNPVWTSTIASQFEIRNWMLALNAEMGKSKTWYKNNSAAPVWNDRLFDGTFSVRENNSGIKFSANTKFIGPEFRSPGAQTKRVDYTGLPTAYSRITNDQQIRSLNMVDLMRESSFYNLQLRPYLMAFNPAYDNITPYGDATPNRQGFALSLKFDKKGIPVTAEASHTSLQEVRGEGTKLPRIFKRNNINADIRINEFFSKWKKSCHVSFAYRDDRTTRPQEELVRGVDLHTSAISSGLEIEVLSGLDLLFGFQKVTYSGFDYIAVLNTYSEIYNFSEYKTDGKESMRAVGLKYRFSEKTFLSGQWYVLNTHNSTTTLPAYQINQFMLLFQMKF